MKTIFATVLIAMATMAGAGTPSSKVPAPKTAWAFHGDGVLDLDHVDTNRPVQVALNREPGHFVRVLLPKTFAVGANSYYRVTSTGMQAHPLTLPERKGFDLVASPANEDGYGLVAVQAPDGKAVILIAHIEGEATRLHELLSFHKFLEAQGYKSPEDAGPQIAPLKPSIILDTTGTTFDKDVAFQSIERRHGGTFIAVVRKEVERGTIGSDERVVLPAGTKIRGTVMTSLLGRWHLWAQKVVFPDGSQREGNGNALITDKAAKSAK